MLHPGTNVRAAAAKSVEAGVVVLQARSFFSKTTQQVRSISSFVVHKEHLQRPCQGNAFPKIM